ncbi:MAG: class II aldolase/adducin family protein [Saprospiraceae bacterium]
MNNLPIDEGYIKFTCHHDLAPPFPTEKITELNRYRQLMYSHLLIGAYPNGIGFGNISQRYSIDNQFIISGTATGNFEILTNEHYALVTEVATQQNALWCRGPLRASSESMSHAVIYHTCPEVNAVIHVHNLAMWKRLLHQVPTTDLSAAYGTPEMANSIVDLLKNTDLRATKLFVMEGHEEGIFAFGATLEEASEVILQAFY